MYTDKCKVKLIFHSIHSYIICADGGEQLVYSNGRC